MGEADADIIAELRGAGLIVLLTNPDHARSKLMSMTPAGQDAYA